MTYLIYTTAILIILSKVVDGHSTAKRIRSTSHEKNAIARVLMDKIGISATIFLFVGITFFITVLCLYYVLFLFPNPIFQWSFVVLGLIISTIQFAVAYANYKSRHNIITIGIQKCFYWLRS